MESLLKLIFPVHFVPFQVDSCKNCARNAVPGATNGTRKDGKWLSGKEVSGQDGGKTGVLHSHFDADGALLGCVEACQLTGQPAEAIAQGVVAEDDGKGPEEEHHAACHEVVVNGRDNAAHDKRQAGDADAGHQALNGGETLPLAVNVVECAADGYRDDGDEQNALEHADGVDMDDFTGCNLHQQRRHDRSEDGGGTGHSHRESHVAMTEIAHDVARHTARTTAHEQNAEGKGRVEVPYVDKEVGHARHDDELGAGTDEDIKGALRQNLEIVGGKSQSHGEHDDAENDGLGDSAYPVEGMWEEECEYSYSYHEDGGVIGQHTAERLK